MNSQPQQSRRPTCVLRARKKRNVPSMLAFFTPPKKCSSAKRRDTQVDSETAPEKETVDVSSVAVARDLRVAQCPSIVRCLATQENVNQSILFSMNSKPEKSQPNKKTVKPSRSQRSENPCLGLEVFQVQKFGCRIRTEQKTKTTTPFRICIHRAFQISRSDADDGTHHEEEEHGGSDFGYGTAETLCIRTNASFLKRRRITQVEGDTLLYTLIHMNLHAMPKSEHFLIIRNCVSAKRAILSF
uniref:Cyclin-dependent kinase inhibitor n=1 Tax=Panagrellus redivivus TaxID=6233 RepID=A0A7E4USP9_PANRE